MDLDFDKYCILDGSPTTVLPAPRRRSKVANRKSSGKPKFGNDVSLGEEFIDIGFNRYRSASCRDTRSTRSNKEVQKRGSVYQSSRTVGLLKKPNDVVGRSKIEFSRGSESTFSFGIIDSLCLEEDDSLLEETPSRSSMMSLSEQSTSSVCMKRRDLHCRETKRYASNPITKRNMPPNFCSSDNRENQFRCVKDPMVTSVPVASRLNDGNCPQERGLAINLHKSLSAKLALPHSPTQSESVSSRASSPKSRFTPVRKMFDPFVKSKSVKSPLSYAKENDRGDKSTLIGENRKNTICKSLLNDLSDKPHDREHKSLPARKEDCNIVLDCSTSPAHLHALLKMEHKHGVPSFEFSVKSPEDFYLAKTWKAGNALTWVYTFHTPHNKRKSSASGWGFKDSRESTMLGQMHVSCHLCTELKGAGAFEDSMVTEFVLHDITHSRKSTSSQDNSSSSPVVKENPVPGENLSWGNCELSENSAKTKVKGQLKQSRKSVHVESQNFQPLAASELHPELETAAIVMQVPLEKRESLKFKCEGGKMTESLPNLLDLCQLEQARESSSSGKMHVVIPSGNHSLPSEESRGPSPLLDRWRLGGGCDCGGWDMACRLNVFGNSNIRIAEGCRLMDNQHPTELFVQGTKDNLPAFTMRRVEDGKYAVDFHAQLSSLQAFSIGVAVLHAAESSTEVGQERTKQMFQTDSLRVFPEEEIKNLIDAITEEEKLKVHKKTEDALPSFVVNPPFSPIARV